MSRFVRPVVDVLRLANGDTVTVRRRLNTGEERAMYRRMSTVNGDGGLTIDDLAVGPAKVTAYLLDWTLTDDDGQPVMIRDLSLEELARVVDNLDPDDFREIRDAIDGHIDRQAAARAEEKKVRSGETPSSVTLPSPVAAAGPSTG